ncbi:LysE family translocator [Pseudonocardiaceae bacterium YIM PH 21723]|nr:LysE family translocator [Pseudonocardiaceae bacterium YIM PH 21723]
MPIDQHLLIAFLITTAIAMITPGPDMLFVLGCGMRGGPRAGLFATAGIATSEALHVAVAAAGLTALFAAVPIAFTVVRLAGACYLIHLGWRLLRSRSAAAAEEPDSVPWTAGRAFRSGLITNLLNPKMVAFTMAFLPQFIAPELGRVWLQFLVLGVIMIAFEFLVDGAVGVFAGRIGAWLSRRRTARRRIHQATGAIFVGLGVRLAVDH